MTSLSSDQNGHQAIKDKMQMLINTFSSLNDDGLYFGIENQNDTHEASSVEDEAGLADRFANIDLEDDSEENTERILSLLTDQERRQFDQLLSSGNIRYLIPKKGIWIPWWMKWKSKLVTEIDADENCVKDTSSAKTELPPKGLTQEEIHCLNKIPCLMSTSKPPSSCLPYNILNVVVSYCFVCRYFNGYHLENWDEAIDELTQVSPVIADGSVSYPDCPLAIHSSLCILTQEKKTPSAFIDVLLRDSLTIFQLKEGLLKVFLEIKKMLLLMLQDTEKNDDRFSRKRYKLLLKRIEYYLSFCRDEVMLEQSMRSILLGIESEAILIRSSHKKIERQSQEMSRKGVVRGEQTSKKLIEEIN